MATEIVRLSGPADASGWREAARRLDDAGVPPEAVIWRLQGEADDLFARSESASAEPASPAASRRAVPRELVDLFDEMLLHRDPERFALAYRLLWRTRATPHLMELAADADVVRAQAMAKAVRRDRHKMKAFVRFRKRVEVDGAEIYIAWHEPDHFITASVAPFFMRRFTAMKWSILTPEASAHWDGKTLTIGAGAERSQAPEDDELEDYWRAYYASIFNPARLKVKAMTAEMPRKFWKNLPEAELIAPLIRSARERASAMVEAGPTIARALAKPVEAPLPAPPDLSTLEALSAELGTCRRCPLHLHATQGVPGQGKSGAAIMFVGEQPGDQEDLAGAPFVGPAGRLLDIALERAGIERSSVYVTNAVKHFKFEPRGKRRIHKKPNAEEIGACRFWLDREIGIVRPKLFIALGASALLALTGRTLPVQASRGLVKPVAGWEPKPHGAATHAGVDAAILATVHPSFLLRLEGEDRKRAEWHAFLADLRAGSAYVAGLAA
jgi:DNA polymerase